jgi:hypothetical protein
LLYDTVARLERGAEHCFLPAKFQQSCLDEGHRVPREIEHSGPNLHLQRTVASSSRRLEELVVAMLEFSP